MGGSASLTGRYVIGVVALSILLGGVGLAAVALRRRHLPRLAGPEALLGDAVVAVALLSGIVELLGTARLFRLVPLVACGALAGALGWRARRPFPATPAASRRLDPLALVSLVAAATVLAEWAVPTLDSYLHGVRTFDSLWYHLPWAASFAHTGQITTLRFTDVEYLTAFYPASAEAIHGLGIALLGRDTLSPALNLLWLGLDLLAAWCVGARRGRGAATLLAGALLLATPMLVFSQAGSAANDIQGIFLLTAALALVLGAGGERAPLALAALACGLALGTKLSLIAPAGALWLSLPAALPAARRRRWLVPWLGWFVLGGAFWYARNLIAVGNPLPWIDLPGLAVPAPALQAHTGFSLAHYLTSSRFWTAFGEPGLRSGLGRAWLPLGLLALLGPLAALRGRELRAPALVALVALIAYVLTPESAAGPAGDPAGFAFNLRYAAPALVLCFTVAALAVPARIAVPGLLVLLALTLAEARLWPARRALDAGLIAVGCVAVLGVLTLASGAGRRHHRPAAALITLVALAVGGYFVQRSYLSDRYQPLRGVSQMSGVWARFRRVHGARVALVGTFGGFFGYPLWGLDDSDPVSYVARRGPHGSFTPIGTCRAWRRAIDAGRFDYVVATPGRDPWHPRRLTPSPEAGWTAEPGASRLVYRHTGAGATIFVFRLLRRLNPAACG